MIKLIGIHRANYRHFVRDLLEVWNRIGHPNAAFAILSKLMARAEQLWRAGGESEFLSLREIIGTKLRIAFYQFRFVIEQIQVRRSAGHVQVNDPLGLRQVMRLTRRQRVHDRRNGLAVAPEQSTKCNSAKAELPARAQKLAAGNVLKSLELKRCVVHEFSASLKFHPGSKEHSPPWSRPPFQCCPRLQAARPSVR